MEVRTHRHAAAAAALLAALAACTDVDDGEPLHPGPENPPGSGPSPGPASAVADLERLIADADAYLHPASIRREDAGFSTLGEPVDDSLITDLFAGFERAPPTVTWRRCWPRPGSCWRSGPPSAARSTAATNGVTFDDVPDEEDADGEFS